MAKIAAPVLYQQRLRALRETLRSHRLDGYLIQNRMDQYWLTGFTGEDGAVLVTPRVVVLITDGRFDETADVEAPWAKKVLRTQRGPAQTAQAIGRYKIERLGFNPDHMNVRTLTGLRTLVRPTKLTAASGLLVDLRVSKSAEELACMRRAIDVAERAFKRVRRLIKPGAVEREIAAKLTYEMQRLGASGPSFAPIVAAGANASLPHYRPGATRVGENDAVLIDWGARVDWYCSDLTRVAPVGSLPARLCEVQDIVCRAQAAAIAEVRAGVAAADVDEAARRVIAQAGFGKQFKHSLGHGLGLDVHEAPSVGRMSKHTLVAGAVVTIEPGIYLPGVGGVRIEDDVLVTEDGAERLSTLPPVLSA